MPSCTITMSMACREKDVSPSVWHGCDDPWRGVAQYLEESEMKLASDSLTENSIEYETLALVAPTGFREYDARWLYRKDINLNGVRAVGLGFGTLLHDLGIKPEVVTGHDFREYSCAVKQALITGLMA